MAIHWTISLFFALTQSIEERGWEHGSHRLLFGVAGWLDRASVEAYLDRVREFVAKAEQLLNDR